MKKKPLDRGMNALSLLLLAGVTVWLCLTWGSIPAQVPLHYNAAGQIDRWGGKGTLMALGVIAWAMFVWILAAAARCRPLSAWFLPVVLGAVFGDMLYWFIRVFRAR